MSTAKIEKIDGKFFIMFEGLPIIAGRDTYGEAVSVAKQYRIPLPLSRSEIGGFTLSVGSYSVELVTERNWPAVLACYRGLTLIWRIGK